MVYATRRVVLCAALRRPALRFTEEVFRTTCDTWRYMVRHNGASYCAPRSDVLRFTDEVFFFRWISFGLYPTHSLLTVTPGTDLGGTAYACR
jgi:hypothetical protein